MLFVLSLAVMPACIAGAGDPGGREEPLPTPPVEEVSIDGGYIQVDTGRQDVIEIYRWLKSRIREQGIVLSGDRPEEAWVQVVAGYKYRLFCAYRAEDAAEEGLLLVQVFHRSDGVRKIDSMEFSAE